MNFKSFHIRCPAGERVRRGLHGLSHSIIRSFPVLDHIPLYCPLNGGVQREGLVTGCLYLPLHPQAQPHRAPKANGSHTKPMAPTCAEPSEADHCHAPRMAAIYRGTLPIKKLPAGTVGTCQTRASKTQRASSTLSSLPISAASARSPSASQFVFLVILDTLRGWSTKLLLFRGPFCRILRAMFAS